jgi:hypothetical protein
MSMHVSIIGLAYWSGAQGLNDFGKRNTCGRCVGSLIWGTSEQFCPKASPLGAHGFSQQSLYWSGSCANHASKSASLEKSNKASAKFSIWGMERVFSRA